MNRIILIFFIFLPIVSFSQIENRWQPDSIYNSQKVKKIYVYLNSPKDLSEIVEFDKNGNKIRTVKYSASYNRKTRKRKTIDKILIYKYDLEGLLIKEIDSTIYFENESNVDQRIYEYDSLRRLKSIKFFQRDFEIPITQTHFFYNPYKTVYTRRWDSIIVAKETKEFDKNFYVRKRYLKTLEPTLKKSEMTFYDKDSTLVTEKYSYSDYKDLKEKKVYNFLDNKFDKDNKLISSIVEYSYGTERKLMYELNYKYYKNGLLKSVRGYVPRYFKYEFWE